MKKIFQTTGRASVEIARRISADVLFWHRDISPVAIISIASRTHIRLSIMRKCFRVTAR